MGTQKIYALILGIILAVFGVLGFVQSPILGLFGVNAFHNVLHIIAGGFGIYVGLKGVGPGYNKTIGWIGVGLFVLGFIPGINTLLQNLIELNMGDNILHVVIGLVSLGVGYGVKGETPKK